MTTANTPDPTRVDRAMLWIDVPAPKVFRAWTDAEALAQWLPPEGMTAEIKAFDPRPGGLLRMTLHRIDGPSPDAKSGDESDDISGRFVVVQPNSRLVLEVEFVSDRPEFAGRMMMDWTFSPDKTGTTVRIAAFDVPPGIRPDDHEAGLASSLDNLSRYLSKEDA